MVLKYIVLCVSLLFLMTCEKENDCAAVSCIAQTFSVTLVDTDGTNLIESGAYTLDDISVFKGDNQVNSYQNSQLTAIVFLLSGNAGDNTYRINLNASETDSLMLNLTIEDLGGDCCGPTFRVNSARYNGDEIEIETENFSGNIVVVKS